VAVLLAFFTKHWTFRWRQAMNDYYMKHWQVLRRTEGASQRVQEDTRRFAIMVEGIGASIIQSLQRQTWQEAFDPKNKQQGAIAIGEKFKLTTLFLTGVNCCGKSWP